MTPTMTPLPTDGRARNRGKRSEKIDALVAAAQAAPGQQNAILLGRQLPKSRAQPYTRRGAKAAYRNTNGNHADIYIYWPTED